MMSGRNSAAQAVVLACAAMTVAAGLALPATASAGYPQIRRFRPTITLQQCERGGGQVIAQSMTKTVCTGGTYNGDPVVGE
jgi:hypothetical protein